MMQVSVGGLGGTFKFVRRVEVCTNLWFFIAY